MSKGLSLHIGINHPDPAAYPGGWDDLGSCEKDAIAMSQIAEEQGFSSQRLLTENATAKKIIDQIEHAASTLSTGDIFFLSYAGHGSQIPDLDGDEDDGLDETWVAFDRMIVDDELFYLWSLFPAGTRIVVISDSCHSGTITSVPPSLVANLEAEECRKVPALLSFETALELFATNFNFYREVQERATTVTVNSTVLSITACRDGELAIFDRCQGGLFTRALIKVWDSGKFPGTYRCFFSEVSKLVQTDMRNPQYRVIGTPNESFESEHPFTI